MIPEPAISELERVLREFESATAAIALVPVDDFAEAKAALDRRSWAIADLSGLAAAPDALPEGERLDFLRRLRLAAEAGENAMQRFAVSRAAVVAEGNHWSRIYRSLRAAESASVPHIDCRG